MITPVQARQRIEDDVQWRAAPVLSIEEVDRLLAWAQAPDVAGLVPGDAGYVETYSSSSIADAVALGWRWKQGKVAGQVDVRAGDVSLERSQAYESLGRMASRAGGIGSFTVTTAPVEWLRRLEGWS